MFCSKHFTLFIFRMQTCKPTSISDHSQKPSLVSDFHRTGHITRMVRTSQGQSTVTKDKYNFLQKPLTYQASLPSLQCRCLEQAALILFMHSDWSDWRWYYIDKEEERKGSVQCSEQHKNLKTYFDRELDQEPMSASSDIHWFIEKNFESKYRSLYQEYVIEILKR